MKPILIDTNAYVAITKGDRNAQAIIQNAPRMGISVIVLGELLTGFRIGKREKTNRETLQRFIASPRVELLPITENIAEHYAILIAQLRSVGTPIPTNDAWIAATALDAGYDVFSYDSHFGVVPGLKFGTRLSEFTGE